MRRRSVSLRFVRICLRSASAVGFEVEPSIVLDEVPGGSTAEAELPPTVELRLGVLILLTVVSMVMRNLFLYCAES